MLQKADTTAQDISGFVNLGYDLYDVQLNLELLELPPDVYADFNSDLNLIPDNIVSDPLLVAAVMNARCPGSSCSAARRGPQARRDPFAAGAPRGGAPARVLWKPQCFCVDTVMRVQFCQRGEIFGRV